MLGTRLDEQIHDKNSKEAYLEHARATSEEIIEKFSKCKLLPILFVSTAIKMIFSIIPRCIKMVTCIHLPTLPAMV
jgi:hypothetical protein